MAPMKEMHFLTRFVYNALMQRKKSKYILVKSTINHSKFKTTNEMINLFLFGQNYPVDQLFRPELHGLGVGVYTDYIFRINNINLELVHPFCHRRYLSHP